MFEMPEEKLLYVNETIELELSLTMPQLDEEPTGDIFTCPITLIKGKTGPLNIPWYKIPFFKKRHKDKVTNTLSMQKKIQQVCNGADTGQI